MQSRPGDSLTATQRSGLVGLKDRVDGTLRLSVRDAGTTASCEFPVGQPPARYAAPPGESWISATRGT